MFTFNENEMKTTKTYIQGCNWCNATGIKYPMENYGGTGLTNVCPVCHGLGTIIVTETIDSPDLEKESEPSNEDYLNECIAKATPRLSKIKDVDKHLDEIRGVVPELSDEEIEKHFKTTHYDNKNGHHYRLAKDRIFGAKWYRDRNK
jgi:hypothetical protein